MSDGYIAVKQGHQPTWFLGDMGNSILGLPEQMDDRILKPWWLSLRFDLSSTIKTEIDQ